MQWRFTLAHRRIAFNCIECGSNLNRKWVQEPLFSRVITFSLWDSKMDRDMVTERQKVSSFVVIIQSRIIAYLREPCLRWTYVKRWGRFVEKTKPVTHFSLELLFDFRMSAYIYDPFTFHISSSLFRFRYEQ